MVKKSLCVISLGVGNLKKSKEEVQWSLGHIGPIAQLVHVHVEHLPCKQVVGSSPRLFVVFSLACYMVANRLNNPVSVAPRY